MIATIKRKYTFESSHQLPYVPEGHKCGRSHGHSYKVRVFVRGPIGSDGMVMDFAAVDAHAKPLIEQLDHRCLNEFMPNPTSELMCMWFIEKLAANIPMLLAISVQETGRSCVYMTVEDATEWRARGQ